jgi:HEAT repeat protein
MGKRISISAALECLRGNDSTRRGAALAYLSSRRDARVVTALVRALGDPDDRYRGSAALLLGQIGARADLLLEHLKKDPSPTVRYRCLRNFWPDNARAPEAYRAALEDSDDDVLTEACIKVGLMRRQIPDTLKKDIISALQVLLGHTSWNVRRQACEALYKIGAVDQRVVATLEQVHGQPEAGEYNDLRHFSRKLSRHKREYPPWLFTTGELLQAARDSLNGQ